MTLIIRNSSFNSRKDLIIQQQLNKLANFILDEMDYEFTENENSIDVAIKIMQEQKEALQSLMEMNLDETLNWFIENDDAVIKIRKAITGEYEMGVFLGDIVSTFEMDMDLLDIAEAYFCPAVSEIKRKLI